MYIYIRIYNMGEYHIYIYKYPPKKDLATDVFNHLLAIAAGDPNGTAKNNTLRRITLIKELMLETYKKRNQSYNYKNHSSLLLPGLQIIVFSFFLGLQTVSHYSLNILCGSTWLFCICHLKVFLSSQTMAHFLNRRQRRRSDA